MKLSAEKETMKQWFTEHKMNKTIVFFPKLAFETSGKKKEQKLAIEKIHERNRT